MKSLRWIVAGLCMTGVLMPLTSHAAKADGKKAKLIAKYDKNGNGAIDGKEMAVFRKDFAKTKEGALKGYDKNKDGKLSDEEIKAIKPGASVPGSKKAKKEADNDTPDEK